MIECSLTTILVKLQIFFNVVNPGLTEIYCISPNEREEG